MPVIQSVYQPWVTRLYSHLRTSKPVAALYHNLCPHMCCCPATLTEYFRCFYLFLRPYGSAWLGTGFTFGCSEGVGRPVWVMLAFQCFFLLAASWQIRGKALQHVILAKTSEEPQQLYVQWENTRRLSLAWAVGVQRRVNPSAQVELHLVQAYAQVSGGKHGHALISYKSH